MIIFSTFFNISIIKITGGIPRRRDTLEISLIVESPQVKSYISNLWAESKDPNQYQRINGVPFQGTPTAPYGWGLDFL